MVRFPPLLGYLALLFFSVCHLNTAKAQQADTLASGHEEQVQPEISDSILTPRHSPHRATIYSLVLPGLGQAYNKKYWKIPIIYAGFGTLYYFIKFNDSEYKKFREAYYHSLISGDTLPPVNEYEEKYEPEALLANKDYYRRNRDFTYILTALWYLLNVVDATVDAHLYTWEIDEDLTLRLDPSLNHFAWGGRQYSGLKLTLNFR